MSRPLIYDDFNTEPHAHLAYGVRFGLGDLVDGFDSLDALFREVEEPVQLIVAADLENTPAEALGHTKFVVGVSLMYAEGGEEQMFGRTFEELNAARRSAARHLEAVVDRLGAHLREGWPEPRLYLTSAGALCTTVMVKGRWDPDLKDHDPNRSPEDEIPEDEVQVWQGTDAGSQDPWPHGGVLGLLVASSGYEYGGAAEVVDLDGDVDARVNGTLRAAALADCRYHLITIYD